MSGNSHDRRVEARGLNYMQRVFDALKTQPWQTKAQLSAALRFNEIIVEGAFRRLRAMRALASTYSEGEWRFAIQDSAARPVDRRGGNRQLQQAAA